MGTVSLGQTLLERRLIDLLASKTGKLKDVLDVEQALARVREEIERYEGRVWRSSRWRCSPLA